MDLGNVGSRGRDKDIMASVSTAVLEDLAVNFFLRRQAWCRDRRTWATRRQGRVVRSRMDYILGSGRWIFQNVAVWIPRHNSDHFMVVGSLHGSSPREHSRYLGSRTRLPLRPPGRQTRTRADKLFTELRRAVPKPDKQAPHQKSWISADTWRLVNKRVSTRRESGRDQRRLRKSGRTIQASLKEYR